MKNKILIGLIVFVAAFSLVQILMPDKYEKVVQEIVSELKIEDKELISEIRTFVKSNWEIFEQEKIEEVVEIATCTETS